MIAWGFEVLILLRPSRLSLLGWQLGPRKIADYVGLPRPKMELHAPRRMGIAAWRSSGAREVD
jgi:hypothetical protein